MERAAWKAAMVVVGAVLSGCAGSREAAYTDAYKAKNFEEAYQGAALVASQESDGPEHDRAALIAGMAAEGAGRDDDAVRWLSPLVYNADDAIAGRAAATLGIIAQERGQWLVAAQHYQTAAKHLQGDDAARCALRAGDCLAQAGLAKQAGTQYATAKSTAVSPEVRKAVEAQTKGPFAVQLGAFKTRERANQVAATQRSAAASAGLIPRVEAATDALGRTVWAVRAGKFTTRPEALAAQQRMRASGAAVVAVAN